MNIVFMGAFTYPKGMAGTKRIQHIINVMQRNNNCNINVVTVSQKKNLSPEGNYEGVKYKSIINENGGYGIINKILWMPRICIESCKIIKSCYKKNEKNFIYQYGNISYENLIPILYAKILGFTIVFDIVENIDFALNYKHSIQHTIKILFIKRFEWVMKFIASGVIVISTNLLKKYSKLVKEKIPIHYHPITVEFKKYDGKKWELKNEVVIFYSGSFAGKDGVPVLIKALENMAKNKYRIRMVMTGSGTPIIMKKIHKIIESSPYNKKIDFKGYLDEDEYIDTLMSSDILCMTREKTKYADAGFPFKLGEYLATGRPVIASKVSDIPKLMRDREEIFLLEPGSVDDIVKSIEYIIENPKEAAVIGMNGRRRAKELFDSLKNATNLMAFLLDIEARASDSRLEIWLKKERNRKKHQNER